MKMRPPHEISPEHKTTLTPFEFWSRKLSRPEPYRNLMMAPIHAARWQRTLKHLGSLSSILGRPVNVLQIGANDGKQSDPVHRFITDFGWRGVLVEPVSRNFEALEQTYATQVAEGAVRLVRAAIGHEIGQVTMYVPKPGDDVLRGEESLHPRVIERHNWMVRGSWEDHMVPESVPALTLSALLTKFPTFVPDVFVTDTEGHDAAIIDQVDLTSPTRPSVMMYEHAHLLPGDRRRITGELIGAGYALTVLRRDTVAMA